MCPTFWRIKGFYAVTSILKCCKFSVVVIVIVIDTCTTRAHLTIEMPNEYKTNAHYLMLLQMPLFFRKQSNSKRAFLDIL